MATCLPSKRMCGAVHQLSQYEPLLAIPRLGVNFPKRSVEKYLTDCINIQFGGEGWGLGSAAPADAVDEPEPGRIAALECAAAIRWIQAEMADYGLTMEELAAAGCFDPPPPPPPPAPAPAPVLPQRRGQSWDGQGEMPDWLRWAVKCGAERGVFPGRIRAFKNEDGY